MLAAATRPPDRSPPLIPVEPTEGDDVGRFILKTFLVLAILAGGGGGTLTPGRYVKHGSKPLTNLYLGLAGRLGIGDLERFGDSAGPLANL